MRFLPCRRLFRTEGSEGASCCIATSDVRLPGAGAFKNSPILCGLFLLPFAGLELFVNFWYYIKTMSLLIRLIIIVTIVVAVTDTVVFYKLRQHPEKLTVPFLIAVIIITVIPIAINLWYHWLR